MPDRLSELAREALLEITPADTIGADAGQVDEGDGVVSFRFECTLSGYPGWVWTVSVAAIEGDPSVLEVELLPADGALLAPDWVPWSERLADYKAAQEAAAAGEDSEGDVDEDSDSDSDSVDDDDPDDDADDDDDTDDDESDDDSDSEDDDSDDEPHPVLHGGDLDGVDIDELADDDDAADEDDPDDDSELADDEIADIAENEREG
jgi:hypothetical protein